MIFAFQLGRGDRLRALHLEHTRQHGVRPAVPVRLQEMLLRHTARQQRHQPSLVDEHHVFGAHAFVVDDIAAGKRPAFEVRHRRRVARRERIGHDAKPRPIQKRRRAAPAPCAGSPYRAAACACII